MAEEITKGLVKKKLEELEYPKNQDVYENSIILYKEDSYKKVKIEINIWKTAFLKLVND